MEFRRSKLLEYWEGENALERKKRGRKNARSLHRAVGDPLESAAENTQEHAEEDSL